MALSNAEKQQNRRKALDKIANELGYDSHYKMMTAIINGEIVMIKPEFDLIETEFGKVAQITYPSGESFTPADWQGAQPKSLEEATDFDWQDENGRRAIMYQGLPISWR